MGLQNRLRKSLERWPALRKPAHAVWVAAMKGANVLLDLAVTRLGYVPRSLSDRGQDRWIIDEVFPQKTGGFFVELGAADGFSQSNTYVLEKRYGWRGICIEPHPGLFDAMVNRYKRSCTCVPLAVDSERGSVEFVLAGETSGLVSEEADNSPVRRPQRIDAARARRQVKYVEALPLAELLDRYRAPPVIDYFSLDVEGLETRILRNFPFHRYTFLAITIERPTRELNDLLFRHGYHFVRNSLYDTFYVHETLPNFARIKRAPFEQLPAKHF